MYFISIDMLILNLVFNSSNFLSSKIFRQNIASIKEFISFHDQNMLLPHHGHSGLRLSVLEVQEGACPLALLYQDMWVSRKKPSLHLPTTPRVTLVENCKKYKNIPCGAQWKEWT